MNRPTELEDYCCVDKHREIEQRDGTIEHHVVFYEELEIMYAQLLEAIRNDGYEVVAFGPNYTIDDPEDENIHDLMQIDPRNNDPKDGRVWAVFIETDEPFRAGRWVWEDESPEWVDDLPQ